MGKYLKLKGCFSEDLSLNAGSQGHFNNKISKKMVNDGICQISAATKVVFVFE
ncbi:MAG: hypothetical protein KJ915_08615 [Candidatus Omnitrophica bacterium]|nr:hypothetical protein [Candidatus Omnitrophota bacterium]